MCFSTKNKGFSLIELLIVCALFALIVGLTIAHGSFLNRLIIRSEIDKLYSVCMLLQQHAVITNTVTTLYIDSDTNKYHYHGHTMRLSLPLHFGILPGVKGPPSNPQTPLQSAVTFKNSRIHFSSRGIMQPGTLYITDGTSLYALSCGVAQVSYLRKYRYDGMWQLL